MLTVKRFPVTALETNCYVVTCTATSEAVIVDPGEYTDGIRQYIEKSGAVVRHIFVTHSHYDHTGGVEETKRRFGGEVLSARGSFGGSVVNEGDTVLRDAFEGKVLSTPGHTPDSLSLVVGGHAFVGDALSAGAVGGTADRDKHEQLVDSIRQKIFPLGDHVRIYTGHGPCTTVGIERMFNPFFQR